MSIPKIAACLVYLTATGRPSPLRAQAGPACRITVVAQGVNSTEGSVGFVVFSSKEGWPTKYDSAFRHMAAPPKIGDVDVTLDMPPGRYAIAVLHDENGNKKLDRKPSGRPREGFGISNDPKSALKTPSFSSAAVNLECGSRIAIRIRYPGKGQNEVGEK